MGLNEVFKKVSAINEVTELANHKIHLGDLQDIFKEIDAVASESQKAFDIVFKAKGLLTDAKTSESLVVKKYQSAYVELTRLNGVVKGLGLPTTEIDNKLKLVKGHISNHETSLKAINQAMQIL